MGWATRYPFRGERLLEAPDARRILMAIEEQIEDTSNIKGHVVNTKRKYKRDIDEETELKELIAQRDALTQEQEEIKVTRKRLLRLPKQTMAFCVMSYQGRAY